MSQPRGGGPPLSFKTVPGRHRTQKWNVARQYDYSGDDWGGYDAYDDYGDPEPPQQQQYSAPPQMSQPPNWSPQGAYGGLPSQQRGPPERQMSFDEQEERRQFSAGPVMYGSTSGMEGPAPRGPSPAKSATSNASGGKRSGEYRGGSRDFTNPEQVPPPLNTRGSPALSSVSMPGPTTAPVGSGSAGFPPRKGSLGTNDSPASEPARPGEKELPSPPFVRPADIYKRMEAAREAERRASESSGRPSLDDVTRGTDSPGTSSQVGNGRRPLSAVDEGSDVPSLQREQERGTGEQSGVLPPLTGMSSFGNDWYPSQQLTSASTTAQSPVVASTPSMQTTPIATRVPEPSPLPPLSSEPVQQPPDSLTHQSSQGYRSVVNRAFDHSAQSTSGSGSGSVPATPISRDNSVQSSTNTTSDVSDSTSGISPIMSRVPSAATAQNQRQQQYESQQPTIAEEHSTPRASLEGGDSSTTRDVGIAAGVAGIAAPGAAAIGLAGGYRRNFSPPSNSGSPARTPALDTGERRFSEGLAAETITTSAEPSSVPHQGVETMPSLSSTREAETPASETGQMAAWREGLRAGRARAGTDYSLRESDIADVVNNNGASDSPEQADVAVMSMTAAEAATAEKAEQNAFLQTHAGTPGVGTPTREFPMSTATPTREMSGYPLGISTTGTPPPRTATPVSVSGRASPAKGNRVRELTDKFQQIDKDGRRNSQVSVTSSKSSWSRFGSEAGGAGMKRQGTQDSVSNYDATDDVDGEEGDRTIDAGNEDSLERPAMGGREESFRPQLPGGWVSFQGTEAGTPAPVEEYSPVARPGDDEDEDTSSRAIDATTPRASYEKTPQQQQAPDFAPTTRATPSQPTSALDQVKTAGSALGASLLATAGLSHGTRDFGSSEPAEPVDQPETRSKAAIGDVNSGLQAPSRPWLERGDTETTNVTDIASAASSVPPTPPAKDTPPVEGSGQGFARGADYGGYFSGAPLRTGRSPELSKSIPAASSTLAAESIAERPAITPAFSVQSRASDMESDRLRKDIMKSLDDAGMKQRIAEDTDRTQDALDAPDNLRRVELGDQPLPPAEQQSGSRPLLDQRFSWEKVDDPIPAFGEAAGLEVVRRSEEASEVGKPGEKDLPPPPPRVQEPEESPEIKPEMPYERPRSRNLHLMNADSDDEIEPVEKAVDRDEALDAPSRGLSVATSSAGPVSPITKSQENLHFNSVVDATRDGGEGLSAPSPVGSRENSLRLPSYYMLDVPGLEGVEKEKSKVNRESRDAPELVMPMSTRDAVSKELESTIEEDSMRPSTSDDVPPRPISKDGPSPTSPTSPGGTKQKIPPFREILAIKSSEDRIQTYNDTRQTFADMNTGLSDWLSGMLAQHPELASLSTPHGGYGQAADRLQSMKGHKASPSLAKFTRNFSSSQNTPSPQGAGTGDYQPGAEPISPMRTPVKEHRDGGGGAVDMDELRQRGKDLMKNASVLGGKVGGKASAGAKGLLAKGKSRFGSTRERGAGGSKDLSHSSNPSHSNSSSTLTSTTGPKIIDRSDPNTILQPTPVYISRTASKSSSLAPARSQNQTPVSVSSSSVGPLSRTLSRLRERTRSRSASGSRQGSRPRSVVLGAGEGGLGSIQDASPVAARVVDTSSSEEQKDRDVIPTIISPWSEPDAQLRSFAGGESIGVPDRLGVLPSPTAGSFSRSVDSRPRTAISEVSAGIVEPKDSLDPDDVLAQDEEVVDKGTSPPGTSKESGGYKESNLSPPQTPKNREVKDEERDELYDVTPVISKSGPTCNVAVDDADAEDVTPKAVQGEWQSSGIENPTNDRQINTPQEEGMTIEEIARFAGEDEATSGAERDLPQSDDTTTDALSAETGADATASVSPAIDDVDNKSEVSAEDHEESSKESKTEIAGESPSKRSSVSSLGDRQQPRDDPQEVPVIMSSQAVPAGPIYSTTPPLGNMAPTDAQMTQDRGFMDRTYLSRPEMPRPLSYEPRERDSAGEIVQETLNTGVETGEPASEVGEFGESKPFEANFTSLSRHRKQSQNSPTSDRRSKRLSGIFAERGIDLRQQTPPAQPVQEVQQVQPMQPPPRPQPMAPRAPPATFITDEYGLGDLRDLHADDHDDMDLSRENSKQGRRKSGFWDALKRNPSASKEDYSRRSSNSRLGASTNENVRPPPPQGWANDPRRMTVEQPQRSFTTSVEPKEKKKRFSGLGSLFGRSSTTGHKTTDKSKKLAKNPALGRENTQIQTSRSGGRIGETEVFMVPKAPAANTSWIDPYAMEGRPPPGSATGRTYPPGQSGKPPAIAPPGVSPPSGGWYGPAQNAVSPSAPPRQGPPPNFSRLPSHGQRNSVPIANPPEGSRSIDGSYNRPMPQTRSPVGSPPPRLSLQAAPPPIRMPGDQLSYTPIHPALQQRPYQSPDRERQPSSPSAEYGLSPQISGQSEWLRSGREQRGSMPTISPVESKPGSEGYPPGRTMRVGSISEEIARSPAREYPDQQTPYMVSMPAGSGPTQGNRTSYHYARQRRAKQNQPPQDVTMDGRSYRPSLDSNPSQQGHPLLQQQTNTSSVTEQDRADPSEALLAHAPVSSEPQDATKDNEDHAPPPGPPPSWRSRSSQREYIASFQQSQPNRNVRTPRDEDETLPTQKQGSNANPYLSLQLPNLGNINRQDDHSDDERIEMKSASYPGQEWIPSQWD